jgi:DNA/RNA endonuclease YhcR with UshA esterase domain
MLHLALALSIFGLVLIAYVSPSIRPPLSRIPDIGASSLEKAVLFRGEISQTHVFKGGSMILTVSEGGASVDVFVPSTIAKGYKASSLTGKRVMVSGTVQLYRGKVEVAVENPSGVVWE